MHAWISLTTWMIIFGLGFGFTACSAKQSDLHSSQDQRMTLGTAQRNIQIGMSQADVAVALGSPNIVTQDANGQESWVYDKMATEVSESSSGTNFNLLIFNTGKNKRYAASTQRTLTVVIKFDEQKQVSDLKYHSSQF